MWMDDSVSHGREWMKSIESHLKRCDVFVLLMTPRALDSHWVQCEFIMAVENKKKIFPVLLEDESWYSVATIQYVDVRDGSLPPDLLREHQSSYDDSRKTSYRLFAC